MRALKPCGTDAAYQRHKLNHEDPCDPCKDAHRAYNRAYDALWRARTQYPLGTCTACDRERPIRRYGWCASCLTRWYRHGKPAEGPPPLPTVEQLNAIRRINAQRGSLTRKLDEAIRRGGWEWAA